MGDESISRADGDEKQASSGLPRIVWFRQMIHRWQSSTSSATATRPSAGVDRANDDPGAAPADEDDATLSPLLPAPTDRLPRMVVVEERGPGHGRGPEDDAAESGSPMTPATPGDAPADVPRGCCPVYVGAERRRFVVPTAYLGMPVFRRLLEKAEEEFEFHYHGGALTIPCDTEAFKYILLVMDRHRQGLVDDGGNAKNGDGVQQGGSLSSQSQAR